MRLPSTNKVTLGFGATTSPYTASNPHKGVDFSHSPDPKIYAPEAGKITFRGVDGTCGNKIWLEGATGRHTFCHLSSFGVNLNQQVSEGDTLGVMGSTGYAFGAHLHWVLLKGGSFVNPLNYVTNNAGDIMQESKVYELLNARDKRLDKLEKSLNDLYNIVDQANKNIALVLNQSASGDIVGNQYKVKIEEKV